MCREKSGLRHRRPKAGPSSALKVLGVSGSFLFNEGLDYPISQGPSNFGILTLQVVVRAVVSVSLRVLVL